MAAPHSGILLNNEEVFAHNEVSTHSLGHLDRGHHFVVLFRW